MSERTTLSLYCLIMSVLLQMRNGQILAKLYANRRVCHLPYPECVGLCWFTKVYSNQKLDGISEHLPTIEAETLCPYTCHYSQTANGLLIGATGLSECFLNYMCIFELFRHDSSRRYEYNDILEHFCGLQKFLLCVFNCVYFITCKHFTYMYCTCFINILRQSTVD